MNPCSGKIAKPANKSKLQKKMRHQEREAPSQKKKKKHVVLMSNIPLEDGVRGRKNKSESGKKRENEGEQRGMEHNINYLIMHFIISVTTECPPSLTGWPMCAAAPPFNEVDKE